MNHPFFGLSLVIHSLVILISRLRNRPLFAYYRQCNKRSMVSYVFSAMIILAMATFFVGSGAYLIDQGVRNGNNVEYAFSAVEYLKTHMINGANAVATQDVTVDNINLK